MLRDCRKRIYADKNIFICDIPSMLPLGELFGVGDLIRKLRVKNRIKGATQIKQKLHVNKDTLSRIERTSKYDDEALERIAKGLGTTFAELLETRDALRAMGQKNDPIALSACCAEHAKLCQQLHAILIGPKKWADGIIANIEAMHDKSTGSSPPERDRLPLPGDSIVTEHAGVVIVPGAEHGKSKRKVNKR
jgi:transcriptional regulator with XRE-family HTH domain